MVLDTREILNLLTNEIYAMNDIQSIGISGGKSELPHVGEGDIDIFIYCDKIPESSKRQAAIDKLGNLVSKGKINVFEEGHWGIGDFLLINGVETWLMYFTTYETSNDVESILRGEYPDKLDNYYYPVGRLAMLKDITVLYDKNNYLNSLKKRLAEYPDELSEILIKYHLDELDDIEDLERAVTRQDVLFYHFALDLAIDHFLQALFAMNKIYFPSRKRTLKFIGNFNIKPEKCGEKLLEVISLGSCSDSIEKSYELWGNLVNELKNLCISVY